MTPLRLRHLLLGLMCAGASCRNQSDGQHPNTTSSAVQIGQETSGAAPSATTTQSVTVAPVALEGVDSGKLTPREQQLFSQSVNELMAPCPDAAVSVAQCVAEKRSCKACLPAARFLLHHARTGRDKMLVRQLYEARFDAAAVKTLVVEGSPVKGPPDAPVTLIEFADFECGGCGQMYPALEELQKLYGKNLRFVFKNFPLEDRHANARRAALASIAAQEQGKFWAMHAQLYTHQEALAPRNLEQYAQAIELDLGAFRKFIDSAEAKLRLERDQNQGTSLGVNGTPTIFINGREVPYQGFDFEDLEAWLDVDLELAGIDPKPLHAAEAASAASSEPAPPRAP